MDNVTIKDELRELLLQLKEELDGGFVAEDEKLFVIRQAYASNIDGKDIRPVVDFFFAEPELETTMARIKVSEAKKICFGLLENLKDKEDSEDLREALNLHISCLKDYTANNGKRNEKDCYIVRVKDSAFPMMIYFEEDDIDPVIEKITAAELLAELKLLT